MLVAVLAPMIATHDPIQQNLTAILQSPSAEHWLGTDKVGRDVFSRLVYGTRIDLRVGALAVLIPFVVGSVLGAVSGYFGGVIDAVIMRIVDVFFAFPFYVLVIALVYVLGSGERAIYLAIAAVSWVSYCRIVRAEVLVAKNQDYVVAARLGGLSHSSDHRRAHPAQRDRPGGRLRHVRHRAGHSGHRHPGLSGPGHPAAGSRLGWHDHRRPASSSPRSGGCPRSPGWRSSSPGWPCR